jgi:hypothetical protein
VLPLTLTLDYVWKGFDRFAPNEQRTFSSNSPQARSFAAFRSCHFFVEGFEKTCFGAAEGLAQAFRVTGAGALAASKCSQEGLEEFSPSTGDVMRLS